MSLGKRTLLAFVMSVFLLTSGVGLAATMKSVQIKEGALRSTPSFMGKIIAKVFYGDRVEEMASKNGWAKVMPAGKTQPGWIHDSALTHKKIVLTAGKGDVDQAATGDEIALAGKGFNDQVENAFKEKNPKMDFKMIDQMENMVVSDSRMRQFLQAGQVHPGGGSQ